MTEKPTDYSILIENGKTKGVIFLQNADCFLCLQDKERFNLILTDIEEAEKILKNKIKEANNQLVNQIDNCPIIHKNLKHYRRQYFGYKNQNGDSIIYTTFNWNRYTVLDRLKGYEKDEDEKWKTEREVVSDGCSYHWEVKINLSKKILFDLSINGSA